jgi:hypothetical protein
VSRIGRPLAPLPATGHEAESVFGSVPADQRRELSGRGLVSLSLIVRQARPSKNILVLEATWPPSLAGGEIPHQRKDASTPHPALAGARRGLSPSNGRIPEHH